MTSLAATHKEFSTICRDGVGIGISFELIKDAIVGAVADIAKNASSFYIPVPLTLPNNFEMRIYLHSVGQIPQVNFDANKKIVSIEGGEFQIDFSIFHNGTIEPLHRFDLTLKRTEGRPRVRQSGNGMQFFLEPTGPAKITYAAPIWENANLNNILLGLNIDPVEYNVTERAQLILSLGAVSALLFSFFTIDQFDSITSICKVQPPFDIGLTSEYLVLYTNVYSLDKPPCGCTAVLSKSLQAIAEPKFSISPIVVYISKIPLMAYANRVAPRTMKSSSNGTLFGVEFNLELDAYRDDVGISSHNEIGAAPNEARLVVTTDLHASANVDARLRLGQCDVARADLASVKADLIGSDATITAAVQPGSYTVTGSAVIKVGTIDFKFGGAAYPLNLIAHDLEKLAERKISEAFSRPIEDIFHVTFLELSEIFSLAGIHAFGVTLESDAETGNSVLYGIQPRLG